MSNKNNNNPNWNWITEQNFLVGDLIYFNSGNEHYNEWKLSIITEIKLNPEDREPIHFFWNSGATYKQRFAGGKQVNKCKFNYLTLTHPETMEKTYVLLHPTYKLTSDEPLECFIRFPEKHSEEVEKETFRKATDKAVRQTMLWWDERNKEKLNEITSSNRKISSYAIHSYRDYTKEENENNRLKLLNNLKSSSPTDVIQIDKMITDSGCFNSNSIKVWMDENKSVNLELKLLPVDCGSMDWFERLFNRDFTTCENEIKDYIRKNFNYPVAEEIIQNRMRRFNFTTEWFKEQVVPFLVGVSETIIKINY